MGMWDAPFETETKDHRDDQVLVAVVPSVDDWARIRVEHWYRIPLKRAPQRIGARYLAFYHPKAFDEPLRWTITYYAPIERYRITSRRELLPNEADHPRADDLYYRLDIGPLERLPHPIPSLKLRRVTFISTTLSQLLAAQEINDLWQHETARTRLWQALQAREVLARYDYRLSQDEVVDLAVPCEYGGVAIELVDEAEARLAEAAVAYVPTSRVVSRGWVVRAFAIAEVLGDAEGCATSICEALTRQQGQ